MWQERVPNALAVFGAATGAAAASGGEALIDCRLAAMAAIGLPVGILARAGLAVHQRESGEALRRDLLVSVLISAANFVLVLWFATAWGLSHVATLGLSMTIAFGGIASLNWAVAALKGRIEATLNPTKEP